MDEKRVSSNGMDDWWQLFPKPLITNIAAVDPVIELSKETWTLNTDP
jgi:hypothetical protein